MNNETGCPDCDKARKLTDSNLQLCLKHNVEHLKWCAEVAQKDYEEAKAKLEIEK